MGAGHTVEFADFAAVLVHMVRQYGPAVLEDSGRCSNLVRDLATAFPRERKLFCSALGMGAGGLFARYDARTAPLKLRALLEEHYVAEAGIVQLLGWFEAALAHPPAAAPRHEQEGRQAALGRLASAVAAAARQADPEALYRQGLALEGETGDPPPPDFAPYHLKATDAGLACFMEAARLGHSGAHHRLAWYYLEHKRDNEKALEHFEQAKTLNNADALADLAMLYYLGYRLERDVSEAFRNAFLAIIASSTADNPNAIEHTMAQTLIGDIFYFGEGVTVNEAEAYRLYSEAAKQGNRQALFRLGSCYYAGKGTGQNYHQAAQCFMKSALLGLDVAQFNLGVCYEKGHGVTKDLAQAAHCYEQAALSGHPRAQRRIGLFYEHGAGVALSLEKAAYWYARAAEKQDEEAPGLLAALLKKAPHLPPDGGLYVGFLQGIEVPQTSGPVPPPRPKVGRNDPCPCGSGKKYKLCCGTL